MVWGLVGGKKYLAEERSTDRRAVGRRTQCSEAPLRLGDLGAQGLGFGVQGLGLRGLGFRGSGFRV